jgi:hypothetical protein
MKISPKRSDEIQLRALSIALRSPRATPRRMRAVFADALDRYLANAYPPRASSRPRKDERNEYLGADYLIRCAKPKTKPSNKKSVSDALAEEAAKFGISISGMAIRKLPTKHPRAKLLATQFIANANGRDPYADAIREASWHWRRAETELD